MIFAWQAYTFCINLITCGKGFNLTVSSATIADSNQHNAKISLLDGALLKRFTKITWSTFPKKNLTL